MLVRSRPPMASILVCRFVVLARVVGERQPCWTWRAGFLLLVEESILGPELRPPGKARGRLAFRRCLQVSHYNRAQRLSPSTPISHCEQVQGELL